MQTLAVDIATTFIDDAVALATGLGRAVLKLAMAPIDRIANACDIAGVLTERRATFRMWRATAPMPAVRAAASACSAAPTLSPPRPSHLRQGTAGTFRSARMQYPVARKELPCPAFAAVLTDLAMRFSFSSSPHAISRQARLFRPNCGRGQIFANLTRPLGDQWIGGIEGLSRRRMSSPCNRLSHPFRL